MKATPPPLLTLFQLLLVALHIPALYSQSCDYDAAQMSLTCNFFDQLKNATVPSELLAGSNKIQRLILKPEVPITFSKRTIYLDDFSPYMGDNFAIELEKIKSIDYKLNPLEYIIATNIKGDHSLKIADSELNYEYQGLSLNGMCNLADDELKSFHLFMGFRRVELLGNVKYGSVCPLIFRDVNLDVLSLHGMQDDNKLTFTPLIDSSQRDLKSIVRTVELIDTRLSSVGASSFYSKVFSSTRRFVYQESSDFALPLTIGRDTFDGLPVLDELELSLSNMDLFFSNETDLDWLYRFNVSSTQNGEAKLILRDQKETYTFPNDDICSFSQFPSQVVPIIYGKEGLKCTCVLSLILGSYLNRTEAMTPSVKNCFPSSMQSFSIGSRSETDENIIMEKADQLESVITTSTTEEVSTSSNIPDSSSTISFENTESTADDNNTTVTAQSSSSNIPDSSSTISLENTESTADDNNTTVTTQSSSSSNIPDSSSTISLAYTDSTTVEVDTTTQSQSTTNSPRTTSTTVTISWSVDLTTEEPNDPQYCKLLLQSCEPETTTPVPTTTPTRPSTPLRTDPTLSFLKPTKAPNTGPDSSFSTWMIVLGVVGACVFVGIAVVFLLKYKRNQKRLKQRGDDGLLVEDEFVNIGLKRMNK